MKVLMLSSDWRVAVLGSPENKRMARYASVTEELHIIVFTKKGQELKPSSGGNMYVYPTNSSSRWFYGMNAKSIAKKLRKINFDVVTSQDPFEIGLIGYKIAKMLGAGLQLQMHTDWLSPYFAAESSKNKVRVKIAKELIPKADGIRVVSKRIKDGLMKYFPGIKEPIVLPIHLDIPVAMLAGKRDLLKKKYPRFGTICLMVSRLEQEKNIFMTLNAMANIIKRFPGTGLVIVGEGSMRPKLEQAVQALGLSEEVVFEGWHNDIIPYYLSADIFINSSNYEGYCRTLMEAGAAGCSIVTTDVGVVGEVFTEDNALISAPGDLEAFQNNLSYAFSNQIDMERKAEKAREAVTHYISFTENDRLQILKKSWEDCIKR